MKHRLGHILFVALSLLWLFQAGAVVADNALRNEPAQGPSTEQAVGRIDTQSRELFGLIRHSLQSDSGPFSYGQAGSRNVLPALRLNPHLKIAFGTLPGEPAFTTEAYATRQAVQRHSRARFRASLDREGYYVFALRKIII